MESIIKTIVINILFIILVFTTAMAFGQNQTIKRDTLGNGDTIVIYKSPMVISQKVYVEEIIKPTKIRPYAAINVGMGSQLFVFKNPLPDVIVKDDARTINMFTAEISYYLPVYKKLYLGLGLQVARFKNKFAYQILETKSYQTTTFYNDTLDTYIATNPITMKDTVMYITESSYIDQIYSYKQQTTTNISYTKTFLEIPLHIRYAFQVRKFNIGCGASLIPSFMLSQKTSKTVVDVLGSPQVPTSMVVRSANFSVSLNLDLGYPVSDNFEIFTQASYRTENAPYSTIRSPIQYHRTMVVGKLGVRMYL